VTVELKNDLAITGTLHSVDQYLNIKLTGTHVVNEQKYPHMVSRVPDEDWAGLQACAVSALLARLLTAVTALCVALPLRAAQMSVRNCFVRGSVVRYVLVSL
jgi:small nuclear ribonucleoprotein (snRNP)-like protein